MRAGTMQRLVGTLKATFDGLQVDISMADMESLAITIDKVMTVQTRDFHTLGHVFDLAESANPIQSLAALFHDIVYYQVDKGFAPAICDIISPYVREKDEGVFVAETVAPDDRLFRLTLDVFDFKAGQQLLPLAGLNEFLSALFANKRLEGIVPDIHLLKATVCIEATIPFRGANEQGESHFEVLEDRLAEIDKTYNFSMTTEDIQTAIKWAAAFANKDVGSFAERDAARFLDSTWKLLPETNDALRSGAVYSIRDYRQALQKMADFLSVLNPDNVFHAYRGVPPAQEFQHMAELARDNIHTAREYLGVKLLAMAIYESLAELTGGDAPLSLFAGDIPKEGEEKAARLEDFLPAVEVACCVDQSATVLELLASGRAAPSNFDLKNSPLSLFLYQNLGDAKTKQLVGSARELFDGKLTPREFLARIDHQVVSPIARAAAVMVSTRREALLQYAA